MFIVFKIVLWKFRHLWYFSLVWLTIDVIMNFWCVSLFNNSLVLIKKLFQAWGLIFSFFDYWFVGDVVLVKFWIVFLNLRRGVRCAESLVQSNFWFVV